MTDEAKLRKTASDDSTILEIIPRKDEVEILEDAGDWYKVNYKKIKGYVKKEFIEVKEEVNTAETNTIQENEQITNETKQENSNSENTTKNELKKGTIVSLKENTKLHVRPLVNSIVVSELEKTKKVEIVTIINNWAYVNAENKMGWIKIDMLKAQSEATQNESEKKEETKKGYISVGSLNFRKEASSDSEVIDVLSQNTEVTILDDDGTWYKVKYKDKTGYLLKKYVSNEKTKVTSRSSTSRTTTSSSKTTSTSSTKTETQTTTTTKVATNPKGQEIANYAKQFVGSKYVYGAASPSKGFDCSGLTMYVYSKFGVNLPHSSSSQSKCGTTVSKSDLKPGDLVFFTNFKTGKGIGHVGIYIGGNQFVHASTEKTGVIISSLSGSGYANRYVKAVRITK